MKKNYLKIALVSAFAMAAGYNVYSSQEEVKLSGINRIKHFCCSM